MLLTSIFPAVASPVFPALSTGAVVQHAYGWARYLLPSHAKVESSYAKLACSFPRK